MSQTVTVPDDYLMKQAAPPQAIELNPQFGNVRMITPIGRFAYANLVVPKAAPGNAALKYGITLLLNPASCGDIYKAICMVADHRWPQEDRPDPANNMQMRRFKGSELLQLPKEQGGLHYPLRNGDHTYMKEPAKYGVFRGVFSINAAINDKNKNGQSNQPPCFDESGQLLDPAKVYSGCYGRLQITVFAFPQPGQQIPNRGVGIMLNTVQFARHGERLAGFDAVRAGQMAFAAAGAIPVDPNAPQGPPGGYNPGPGFGPNSAGPGSIPPGFAQPTAPIGPQAGFAAPQQQAAPAQWSPPQQQAPAAQTGFQQPWQPPSG